MTNPPLSYPSRQTAPSKNMSMHTNNPLPSPLPPSLRHAPGPPPPFNTPPSPKGVCPAPARHSLPVAPHSDGCGRRVPIGVPFPRGGGGNPQRNAGNVAPDSDQRAERDQRARVGENTAEKDSGSSSGRGTVANMPHPNRFTRCTVFPQVCEYIPQQIGESQSLPECKKNPHRFSAKKSHPRKPGLVSPLCISLLDNPNGIITPPPSLPMDWSSRRPRRWAGCTPLDVLGCAQKYPLVSPFPTASIPPLIQRTAHQIVCFETSNTQRVLWFF